MYPVQIPGTTFRDNYNRAYLQSLTPPVFGLWQRSGKFGIPLSGTPADANEIVAQASKLAAGGELVTWADMTGMEPFLWMQGLVSDGYPVFSYVGQGLADWSSMPPGQHDPAGKIPDYNPSGHTGVVSFALLPPYTGPVPPVVLLVGERANAEGWYNVINGGELKDGKSRPVGDEYVENSVQYVFLGLVLGVYYWQYIGRS